MKRTFSIIICLMLVFTCTIGVYAAGESAFSNIMVTANTKIVDEPGTANPIAYMEAYGVGYSSKGDQVIFEGIDFGSNGANKFYINFSFGNKEKTTNIAIYIDKKSDKPAATLNIGDTGGWESKFAKEFSAAITVPSGKHDIIVEFMDETGSFTYIRFDEAPKAAVTTPTSSAATADPIVITVILAAVSTAGAVIAKKRG